jgi:hypothetical protein
MNIKIGIHLMPWELDYCLSTAEAFGKAKQYLNPEDNIKIAICLNLSNYIIDWNLSLTKQFFIDKFNYLLKYFNEYEITNKIYEGNNLYGHLDFQKEIIDPSIDYYIQLCPDTYFHPHLLYYLIESAKLVKDEYFIITPEIPKLWDHTWDLLVNPAFLNIPYTEWNKQNLNDIIYFNENNHQSPKLEKISSFKYAGWFDLYNKNFFEKLLPVLDSWHGYGPWDLYGMIICTRFCRQQNINVQQYILRNQIICDRMIGVFEQKQSPNFYKKYLHLNNIPNQRASIESQMEDYIQQWKEYAIKNKIIHK